MKSTNFVIDFHEIYSRENFVAWITLELKVNEFAIHRCQCECADKQGRRSSEQLQCLELRRGTSLVLRSNDD